MVFTFLFQLLWYCWDSLLWRKRTERPSAIDSLNKGNDHFLSFFALRKFITGFPFSNFRLSALVSCQEEELRDTKGGKEKFFSPIRGGGICCSVSPLHLVFVPDVIWLWTIISPSETMQLFWPLLQQIARRLHTHWFLLWLLLRPYSWCKALWFSSCNLIPSLFFALLVLYFLGPSSCKNFTNLPCIDMVSSIASIHHFRACFWASHYLLILSQPTRNLFISGNWLSSLLKAGNLDLWGKQPSTTLCHCSYSLTMLAHSLENLFLEPDLTEENWLLSHIDLFQSCHWECIFPSGFRYLLAMGRDYCGILASLVCLSYVSLGHCSCTG